jgi:hypothetical protein
MRLVVIGRVALMQTTILVMVWRGICIFNLSLFGSKFLIMCCALSLVMVQQRDAYLALFFVDFSGRDIVLLISK